VHGVGGDARAPLRDVEVEDALRCAVMKPNESERMGSAKSAQTRSIPIRPMRRGSAKVALFIGAERLMIGITKIREILMMYTTVGRHFESSS
jgi:hypothetical protein